MGNVRLHLNIFFWWLNPVRLYSLYKILYAKGGYNLTLYWVPWYPQIKYYSFAAIRIETPMRACLNYL